MSILCLSAWNPGWLLGQKYSYEHPIPFNPRTYIAYKVDQPIIIDGLADESAWQDAPWSEYFVDIEGSLNVNFTR